MRSPSLGRTAAAATSADLLERARAWVLLRGKAELGALPRVRGRIWVHGGGRVTLGREVELDASEAPIELRVLPGAVLQIGDGTRIAGGASIEAAREVVIGAHCRVGPFAKVLDSHQHVLTGDRHQQPPPLAVKLEDGVELGARAIVLPGAHLARGARVREGGVVPGRPASVGRGAAGARRTRTGNPLAVKLERAVGRLRAHHLFRGCPRSWRLYAGGAVQVENQGTLTLGPGVQFLRGMIPTELRCAPAAFVEIGADTLFNYGARVEARSSIRIGRRCLIASQVELCDTGLLGTAPITIGDDVWIAHGARIGPGVRVGEGAVISAGAVVRSDVPPRALAAGSPARCVPLALFEPNARPFQPAFMQRGP